MCGCEQGTCRGGCPCGCLHFWPPTPIDHDTPQRRRMGRWRRLRKAWANLMAFFWIDCPICGTEFGGHEWNDGHLALPDGGGTAICPACFAEQRGDNFSYGADGRRIFWVTTNEGLESKRWWRR